MQILLVCWCACTVWLEESAPDWIMIQQQQEERSRNSLVSSGYFLYCTLLNATLGGCSSIFKKKEDMKYGRKSLSWEEFGFRCETHHQDHREGQGEVGKTDEWERTRQENAVCGCHVWVGKKTKMPVFLHVGDGKNSASSIGLNEHGEVPAWVSQRGDGCLSPGNVQGHVGWVSEQPDLVESVPAHCRGFERTFESI